MSKFKKVAMGCALAMTTASINAAQVEDGIKACADAMVKQLSESGLVSSEYALDLERGYIGRTDRLRSRETFHMDARGSDSDELIARVDCVVDRNAQVLRLDDLPLAAEDAMERSVSIY